MSDEAKKNLRKKELEEKRQRLEEYRLKTKQAAAVPVAAPAAPAPIPSTEPSAVISELKKIDNVDDLLKSLDTAKAPTVVPANVDLFKKPAAAADTPTASADATQSAAKKVREWTTQLKVWEVDVPPREVTYYTKGTQTTNDVDGSGGKEEQQAVTSGGLQQTSLTKESSTSSNAAEESSQKTEPAAPRHVPHELAASEKQAILSRPTVQSALHRAARTLERAVHVASAYDVFVDYAADGSDSASGSGSGSGSSLKLSAQLHDARWCRHRSVTDVTVSPKYSELVAVAYSASEAASQDADGLVLVWSQLNLLERPEYVFTCQSPVLSTLFHRWAPTVVIGATYSGQIVLWDTRSKGTPVARTPLSAIGHTHPIYSISQIGSQNAHNLVSVSTDGRLCVWSLENLSQPQEVLELYNKQTRTAASAAPVAVTSHGFPESELNELVVGSEEGVLYQVARHGARAGVFEHFDGHTGPVTALQYHPPRDGTDLGDLFVSSSVDWSVKLWSRKHPSKPLASFEEATDYVYDAKWSPTHPALFASCDGHGNIDVWNLNQDLEQPVIRQSHNQAVNRLCWSADGRRLLSGDSSGHLSIWELGDFATPAANEWTLLENRIADLVAALPK